MKTHSNTKLKLTADILFLKMQFENVSNDGSIYDDAVDEERLLDEEEELLYWVMDGPLQDGVIE